MDIDPGKEGPGTLMAMIAAGLTAGSRPNDRRRLPADFEQARYRLSKRVGDEVSAAE